MSIGNSFTNVLDAARTGAEWAWTAIYRDLAPAVLGYLRAHGAAEPEDLTSEVFLGLVRQLPSFEGDEEGFRSLVFVIAHRRLLDERRHLTRHPVDAVEAEKLDRPEGNAEDDAIASLSTRRVRELIQELAPDQRDVLLLRIIGGVTVDDAAIAMGRSRGAVKALQRRGLATIARKLAKQAVPL